jgi:hypothetical protein
MLGTLMGLLPDGRSGTGFAHRRHSRARWPNLEPASPRRNDGVSASGISQASHRGTKTSMCAQRDRLEDIDASTIGSHRELRRP